MELGSIVVDEVKSITYLYKLCPKCLEPVPPYSKSSRCQRCGYRIKGTLWDYTTHEREC